MILSFDLETVPLESALAEMPTVEIPDTTATTYPADDRAPPSTWKDPAKIDAWREKDRVKWTGEVEKSRQDAIESKAKLIERYIRECSTDPLRGRVVAVGIAGDDREPAARTAPTEQDEAELLDRLWAQLKKATTIVTFNGQGFDLPFLRKRSILLGVVPMVSGSVFGEWLRRYNPRGHFDVMQEWSDWNNRDWPSLAKLAKALLGEDKQHDSATVYERYRAGAFDEIAASASADATQTLAIYNRISPYFPAR